MKTVQIVYGSTGGNTELVCNFITEKLSEKGLNVACDRCEHFSEKDLNKSDLLILASPTYGHGQLEDHWLKSFWKRIQNVELNNQLCAIVGLGDPKYDDDYNIESASILHEFCTTHGGKVIIENLAINRSPLGQLESVVEPWTDKLFKIFTTSS